MPDRDEKQVKVWGGHGRAKSAKTKKAKRKTAKKKGGKKKK
jgi:hypothetical protein